MWVKCCTTPDKTCCYCRKSLNVCEIVTEWSKRDVSIDMAFTVKDFLALKGVHLQNNKIVLDLSSNDWLLIFKNLMVLQKIEKESDNPHRVIKREKITIGCHDILFVLKNVEYSFSGATERHTHYPTAHVFKIKVSSMTPQTYSNILLLEKFMKNGDNDITTNNGLICTPISNSNDEFLKIKNEPHMKFKCSDSTIFYARNEYGNKIVPESKVQTFGTTGSFTFEINAIECCLRQGYDIQNKMFYKPILVQMIFNVRKINRDLLWADLFEKES
jgi:hypothetical protein